MALTVKVWGITPDVNSAQFILQEAEISSADYIQLKARGAVWTDKAEAEKALAKYIKDYKKRK